MFNTVEAGFEIGVLMDIPLQAIYLVWNRIVYLSDSPVTGIGASTCQLGRPDYTGSFLVVGVWAVVSKLLSADKLARNMGTPSVLGGTLDFAIWHSWACAGLDWSIYD
jgi:hypothetical protein